MYYLCVEMSWKGLISRMSDECLITLETVFSYCYDCQAVMRKFTLAGKTEAKVPLYIDITLRSYGGLRFVVAFQEIQQTYYQP